MSISKKISQLSPSPTLSITAKAKKMQAEGINVIGFGAGEPDFDTPVNIKEAAKRAIDKGFTKYTPTAGIKELKEAILVKLKTDNKLEYTPDEVIVSCGAKHSIFNAILTLCDQDDEVILPSPYWVSYPEMIKVAGAKAEILNTTQETNFKITPKQLENTINSKTKLLILNSPSNPTGMVYSEKELKELSKVILKAGIYCLSDEIYEKVIYDERHISIASLDNQMKQKTIVVNGVSKAYSMTGWRIGYCAGPKEIIQAMSNLQDHSTSNPTSIAQAASVEALTGGQDDLKKMVVEFRKRRDYMIQRINSIPKLRALTPQGAFYCWVDVSAILGKSLNGKKIKDSLELTDALLACAQVAVIPGCVFGDDSYIRLSYATSIENIIEGISRIDRFVSKLTGGQMKP
ncbi:MAG: pyridoxal phosphate-dependent aminotransferase [Candidatus Omnitrophica bacterium]|nr:pyridoxal phosphate-dependent aminotransferase [Candidatus Omnitrophota bacterium]